MSDQLVRPQILDELTVTVVVDNETDTLSSVDGGIPQVPEMISLLGRREASGTHEGHDCVTVFDGLCVACHGLSVLVTGRVGDERHTVLFDVGPYGDVWVANAERIGVDLASIEAVFLSHWHWDHSGGFPVAIRAIADARVAAGLTDPLVVDVHPDRPDRRGVQTPMGTVVMLPDEPAFDDLAPEGAVVVTHSAPHLIGSGFFRGSGEIPRVTAYETGLHGHLTFRDNVGAPDPLILDERYLAAEVKGRGVTVLSACSHAGVVNACLAAKGDFPDSQIDLVLGGYHLAGGVMEQRIGDTVNDLESLIDPRIVAPGHCTGWRAKAALADRFAPGRYAPSVVGTRFDLRG